MMGERVAGSVGARWRPAGVARQACGGCARAPPLPPDPLPPSCAGSAAGPHSLEARGWGRGLHHARQVAARDLGQAQQGREGEGPAGADLAIDRVEAGGGHTHEHLAAPPARPRPQAGLQGLGPARGV